MNRLNSVRLCEHLIRTKLLKSPTPAITESIIQSKALYLSSAVESMLGYWQNAPKSVNAKVFSRYYFLLLMTITGQVSSVTNTDDLKAVQKHAQFGHSLATVENIEDVFPTNYFDSTLQSGHFCSYAKSLGINIERIGLEKRPDKYSKVSDKSKLVSLIDLFRRIPELSCSIVVKAVSMMM